MKHLVCIKIGGSVITDKSNEATAQPENIQTFARNMSTVIKDFPDVDILIGNGAGSFGHHAAHKYGLKDGAATDEQFYGVAITHNSVRKLNLLVGDALTSYEVPAYCLSPGDVFTAKNGDVASANTAAVEQLLEHRSVPLIHGDTVLDTDRGVSIFSTEKSLFWLGKHLREKYIRITVVMIVDTGGVLNENGAIIKELRSSDTITTANAVAGVKDVTGGIMHKVTSCRKATEWADAVYIISNTAEDLSAACSSEQAGTRIL